MKNIKLSIVALMALGTLAYAGGDFAPVTTYETEDSTFAEETYVEPVIEENVVKEIVKEPVIVQTAIVETPKPVKKEIKDIHANGFYAGIGITASRYQTNCSTSCGKSGTDKTLGLIVRAGYDFNQYIGLEARGIRTNLKDNGGAIKHAGIFIKPMLPVSDTTHIYGLVGLAKTTTQGSLQRTNAETLALGAGLEVDLSEDSPKEGRYGRKFDGQGDQEKGVGLFMDYERMVVKSGAPDLDALSAGVTYDF
jgi:hypothetical protein